METGGKKASSRTKSETVAEPIIAPKNRAKNKKSKKPLIITLIIVGVLLLCGIGFAIWYFAYYNSDNKVLSDAFHNTLSTTEGTGEVKMTAKAKSTSVTSAGTNTMDVNFGANIKTSYNKDAVALDIDYNVSASIMSLDASANLVANRSGDIFVKVNDLDGLLGKFGITSDQLGGFDINKVSDKWVKISQDDFSSLTSQTGVNTSDYTKCLEQVTNALTDDKKVQGELLAAIQDSKILTAERVGSDQDGIKFRLTGDINAANAFADELKEMEMVKTLSNCIQDFTGDTDETFVESIGVDSDLSAVQQMLDQLDLEVYFWVGTWDHQPNRLSVNVKMSQPEVEFTLDATRKGGKTEVKMPSDSTSLKSIIEDLQSSYTNPYGGTINYDDLYTY